MPRKGSAKVRTGCITCKARKIKCDETQPSCLRCTSTGRKCHGYTPPPPGHYSWSDLMLRVRKTPSLSPDTSPVEDRSLAFFNSIVAPTLSGTVYSSFWTRRVAQMVYHEPAARHAVLAISTLYENFQSTSLTLLHKPDDNPLAIRNYNRAIKHMLELTSSSSLDTALLTCILFVCIEFLRGDAAAAIKHCHHGITLLNSSPKRLELASMFSHMSIFPLFFGGTLTDFPVLEMRDLNPVTKFESVPHAQGSLDSLLCRGVRLVRSADGSKLGHRLHVSAPGHLAEHQLLKDDLLAWWSSFSQLRRDLPELQTDTLCQELETRWLACTIWAATCDTDQETAYDAHMDKFQRIVDLATSVAIISPPDVMLRDKFSFEMGFLPLMHFVVIKCRKLPLRLQAVALMKQLSRPRETLWDAVTMYAVGIRMIEVEHGVEITPKTVGGFLCDEKWATSLPTDAERIRDAVLEPPFEEHFDEDGKRVYKCKMQFMMRNLDGQVEARQDWITMPG